MVATERLDIMAPAGATTAKSAAESFTVLVLDMARRDGEDCTVTGYPSVEMATAYARCRLRSSLEEFRRAGQSPDELRRLWSVFGEDAIVVGTGFAASGEIEQYLVTPASPAELDWQTIARLAGAVSHRR